MKKILIVVVSLIMFSKSAIAEENYFYLDNPIDGIYTMMDKVTKVAANYVKPVRKVGTNEYVYCVTPGIAINPDGNYQKIENDPWSNLNITKEKYEKIQIISYYGYMYGNHTDLKWYAITQYLIWQEVLPEGWSVYFTNTLRGPKTNDFDWMINELNSLVNSYYTNPNISLELEGNYKNEITIYDSNNVLNHFKSNSNQIILNDNTITLKPSNNNYSFNIEYKTDNIKSNLYIYNNAQWVISRGSLPQRAINYQVIIPKGNLKIIKSIKNKEEIDIDYNPSLKEAKYQIFNDYFNSIYSTDDNGIININNLNTDSYYIKEIEAPKGFEIDNNIYTIIINPNETTTINLADKLIFSKINIFKKYLNTDSNTYEDEEMASFGVLDVNDKLIASKNTDKMGYTFFHLPLGNYTVTQLSGKDGYDKIKDEEIEVGNKEIIDLHYYNKPLAINPNDIVFDPIVPIKDEKEEKEEVEQDDILHEEPKYEVIIYDEDNDIPSQNNEPNIINDVFNPQTNDDVQKHLIISIISITILLLKYLYKKKEIEYK